MMNQDRPIWGGVKFTEATSALISMMRALGRAGRRGSRAGKRLGLCYRLTTIKNNLDAALRYQLPRSTFKQHWNDCFGWAICLR